MRYLSLNEVLDLHALVIDQSGGAPGVRDMNALDSAVSQPQMTFGGVELYPTLVDKAAALGFSIVMNHPFLDGNKRVGHAAMETFLILNGCEINATLDEQEQLVLRLGAGEVQRSDFVEWLRGRVVPHRPS
jgi:death-on-curing protein